MKIPKVSLYKVVTNASALIAATTVAYEAHKMGGRKSIEQAKLGGAKDTIKETIGISKLNYPSPLYNETKKGIFKGTMMNPFMDVFHSASGYIQGFSNGIVQNIATIGFAALTLASKSEIVKKVGGSDVIKKSPLKMIGAIGMGASILWNFLQNGTTLFEKKDYLN